MAMGKLLLRLSFKPHSPLTLAELLLLGSIKRTTFKDYDVSAMGQLCMPGLYLKPDLDSTDQGRLVNRNVYDGHMRRAFVNTDSMQFV